MKTLNLYKGLKLNNSDNVFSYFMNNLQLSIADWSYFVDWEKVKTNIEKYKIELNILNSLIGSNNIEEDFINVLKEYPKTREILPLLIAVRNEKLKDMPILLDYEELNVENSYNIFSGKELNRKELIKFFNNSGLKQIFIDKTIKNIVDYCYGIEVGMDTNARKNRSGSNMEKIVEVFIKKICEKHGLKYVSQANSKKIEKELDIKLAHDWDDKKYDFVIKTKNSLIFIEVNFYGVNGSKLNEVSRAYININKHLNSIGYKFVWITDGQGWIGAKNQLRETFESNDYVFNLLMLKNNILDEILI